MIPKLTLDGGLLRENTLLPAINKLRAWEAEGKIELHESDRAKEVKSDISPGWPGAPAPAKRQTKYRTSAKAATTGASFKNISAILFPQRDPQRLNMGEVNDVAHLVRHHSLGHNFFVTTNEHFIDRRDRLQAAFRIVILTPDEAITSLQKSDAFTQVSEGGIR